MMDTNAKTQENVEMNNEHQCNSCNRRFKTLRGLNQHLRYCSNNYSNNSSIPPDPPPINEEISYKWGEYENAIFETNINDVYERIVYWRKNLFMLPTGKVGKRYIDETTRLMNAWTEDSPLKNVAFKVIMIMPSLLLQKPSKNSKSKDHVSALERRLLLWSRGEIPHLLKEAQTIQDNLPSLNKPKTIGEISKQFAECMHKGNINGAMKILTNNMQNGILPLNENTLKLLQQKHPTAAEASHEVLLPDEPEILHPIKFENINGETVRKAALKTKGGSGPSGMDADGWRKLFVENSFGESSTDLCNAFARVIRKLCSVADLHLRVLIIHLTLF